jgi:hypothetical protein
MELLTLRFPKFMPKNSPGTAVACTLSGSFPTQVIQILTLMTSGAINISEGWESIFKVCLG